MFILGDTHRYSLTKLDGKIYPGYTTNYNNQNLGYTSYHETEIYLNNNDVVEFIREVSNSVTNNDAKVWVTLYDSGNGSQIVSRVSFNSATYLSYYLTIENNYYFTYILNPDTGVFNIGTYPDSTPSTYIDHIAMSSELYIDDYVNYLYTQNTNVIDNLYNNNTGDYIKPLFAIQQTDYQLVNEPYVSTTCSWNLSGELETTHIGGSISYI